MTYSFRLIYPSLTTATKHNGLSDEHVERSNPSGDDLFAGETVRLEVGGAVDVLLPLLLPPPLGLSVQQDVRSRLWDDDEVKDLDEPAEDELDPADPFPPYQRLARRTTMAELTMRGRPGWAGRRRVQ